MCGAGNALSRTLPVSVLCLRPICSVRSAYIVQWLAYKPSYSASKQYPVQHVQRHSAKTRIASKRTSALRATRSNRSGAHAPGLLCNRIRTYTRPRRPAAQGPHQTYKTGKHAACHKLWYKRNTCVTGREKAGGRGLQQRRPKVQSCLEAYLDTCGAPSHSCPAASHGRLAVEDWALLWKPAHTRSSHTRLAAPGQRNPCQSLSQ